MSTIEDKKNDHHKASTCSSLEINNSDDFLFLLNRYHIQKWRHIFFLIYFFNTNHKNNSITSKNIFQLILLDHFEFQLSFLIKTRTEINSRIFILQKKIQITQKKKSF